MVVRNKIVETKPLERMWFSTEGLADYLQVKPRWVRDNIKTDPKIPKYFLGKQTFYKRADIDDILNRSKV